MKFELVNKAIVITPSDTADFPPFLQNGALTEWLYVGGTGNIVAVLNDGSTVLLTAVPAGTQIREFGIRRINATNTTATLIVAGYRV